jgi:hypothetical protein
MRLCALCDIGFLMNLGKISAKFLRTQEITEKLARLTIQYQHPSGKLLKNSARLAQ